MNPSISCFYYDFNPELYYFTFIKYEKFIFIYLNMKSVILTIKQLVSNIRLFQIYKLSLLLTKDADKIDTSNIYIYKSSDGTYQPVYGTWIRRYYKNFTRMNNYEYVPFLDLPMENPMEVGEPPKRSKDNKIQKFFKFFNELFINHKIQEPDEMINNYLKAETNELFDYFQRYIKHEKKIEMLAVIIHNYGRDVYDCVNQFV